MKDEVIIMFHCIRLAHKSCRISYQKSVVNNIRKEVDIINWKLAIFFDHIFPSLWQIDPFSKFFFFFSAKNCVLGGIEFFSA